MLPSQLEHLRQESMKLYHVILSDIISLRRGTLPDLHAAQVAPPSLRNVLLYILSCQNISSFDVLLSARTATGQSVWFRGLCCIQVMGIFKNVKQVLLCVVKSHVHATTTKLVVPNTSPSLNDFRCISHLTEKNATRRNFNNPAGIRVS